MPTRSLLVTVVLAVAVAHAATQPRPNLSGVWTADKAGPAGVPAAPSPVFGPQFEVRHDGDRITIVRPVRDMLVSAGYTLDAAETKTTIPGALCQGDTQTIETAAWEGEAIALTMVGLMSPGSSAPSKVNVRRVFRLEGPDTLVVEGTTRQGGKPVQVGTLYRRTAEPLRAGATAPPNVSKAVATIDKVGWIAGVWSGTSGQSTVEERWTPAAGGSMIAVSRTLRNTSMLAFEFLCIAERDGSLVYTALPNGRTPPTYFMLTSIAEDSATFENPSHDYPKLIRYTRKPDGSLETTIAGEGGQRAQSVVLKGK